MGHTNLGIVDNDIFPILLQDDVKSVKGIMVDTFPVPIKTLFESESPETFGQLNLLAIPLFSFSSVLLSLS